MFLKRSVLILPLVLTASEVDSPHDPQPGKNAIKAGQ